MNAISPQVEATCGCIARIDARLAEHNTKIELPWFGPQLPRIITMKKDEKKRGKPMGVFATYCPFCGTKYPEPKDEPS